MSIYKQNIDPIAITEADADAFLRDMDITLYEDTIAIDGTLYDGTYGESILESNGIFLYEDGIVLEGKQADEYRARKAKEKEDINKQEIERNERRYSNPTGFDTRKLKVGENGHRTLPNDKKTKDNAKRITDANKMYSKEFTSRYNKFKSGLLRASEKTLSSDERAEVIGDTKNLVNVAKAGGIRFNDDYTPKLGSRKELNSAHDPINRHMRRHPKQYAKPKNESTIFSDIEII